LLLKNNNSLFWHATDNQEVLDIKTNAVNNKMVHVVGNVPSYTKENPSKIAITTTFRFITISLIAPKKNHLWFIDSLKRVGLTGINIIYDIYGPADREYVEILQDAIAVLPDNIEVNIKSSIIPTEVNTILRSYHYFVLPTYGENFGHAIFEAFNAGVPVLITNKTPWLELERKRAGWDIPLDKTMWDDSLSQCLEIDQFGYDLLCDGARRVAVDYIEAKDLKMQYLDMFEETSKNAQ
jgi:glycosyltransferase involved in cell wall biosynthesis